MKLKILVLLVLVISMFNLVVVADEDDGLNPLSVPVEVAF